MVGSRVHSSSVSSGLEEEDITFIEGSASIRTRSSFSMFKKLLIKGVWRLIKDVWGVQMLEEDLSLICLLSPVTTVT